MAVFCDAVRRRLRLLRISQGELARRVGMAPGHMSNLLNGKSGNCSLETCDKIAAAMDTTTGELLTGQH